MGMGSTKQAIVRTNVPPPALLLLLPACHQATPQHRTNLEPLPLLADFGDEVGRIAVVFLRVVGYKVDLCSVHKLLERTGV